MTRGCVDRNPTVELIGHELRVAGGWPILHTQEKPGAGAMKKMKIFKQEGVHMRLLEEGTKSLKQSIRWALGVRVVECGGRRAHRAALPIRNSRPRTGHQN